MKNEKWHLGQTSERYEVGNRGAGTVAHTKGDHGGASYGLSQFSAKMGSLQEYLLHSAYGEQFRGLKPDTLAFDARWRELAEQDPGFGEDQHAYTKAKFYDTQTAQLKAHGLDLGGRGPAVQDAIWSTAVQFGGKTRLFEKGLNESFGTSIDLSKLSDADIVNAVQDYKIKHNRDLFKSSPRLWSSLESRARHEKADLLKLAEEPSIAPKANQLEAQRFDGAASSGAHGISRVDVKQGQAHADMAMAQANAAHSIFSRQRLGLDSPEHPGNAMYQQAQRGMRAYDARIGRTSDHFTDQAAACVAVACCRAGMTRIDDMDMGTDGKKMWAVQGKPGNACSILASASVEQFTTSIAQSSLNWEHAQQDYGLEQQQQQRQLAEQAAQRVQVQAHPQTVHIQGGR